MRVLTSWREVCLAFGSLSRVIAATAGWDQYHKANIMFWRLPKEMWLLENSFQQI